MSWQAPEFYFDMVKTGPPEILVKEAMTGRWSQPLIWYSQSYEFLLIEGLIRLKMRSVQPGMRFRLYYSSSSPNSLDIYLICRWEGI